MQRMGLCLERISGIGHVKRIEAIIFDDECVVTSDDGDERRREPLDGSPSRRRGRSSRTGTRSRSA